MSGASEWEPWAQPGQFDDVTFDFDEEDSFDDDDVYNHNDSEASSKTERWSIDLLLIATMMKGCFRRSVTNSIRSVTNSIWR